MLLTIKRDKGMTNVEKFFKEWGSVCRMLTKKDKAIYSHKELLDFAEQYHQRKVNNVVLDDVIKCECKYNQGIISVCNYCIDSADVFAA